MHTHVSGVGSQAASVAHAEVRAQQAASMQRAATLRRRLLREAAERGGSLDGEVADLVQAWKGTGVDSRRAVSYYV